MENDKRFAHVSTDPKFRRIPKGERKIKIDKRFKSMFEDKKFKVKYTVDKRGRPVNHSTTEDLKRYYELSSSESEADDDEDEIEQSGKFVKAPVKPPEESEKLPSVQNNDVKLSKKIKKKLKNLSVDYARGESSLFSGSSSDDEEESEEEFGSDSEDIDHKWGEMDADAERTDEITHRLAACNMDWDRIKAIDLMVLFNSFLPSGGLIHSVNIYTSEFGKQRMVEEEVKGPTELVDSKVDAGNENEEGDKYHMEKLRQYQLNRLKYYYAVVTCDSANSANKIYTECDGMEYESSATKIDLRFIPDDVTFDEEPKETCNKLPEVNKYKPRFFTTTALQQAKVDLTWDETDPDRIELTQKLASGKIDDITDADLQDYLASSSGEENDEDNSSNVSESDNDDNPIDKYKALLQDIEEKDKKRHDKEIGMEISWGTDLQEKTSKLVKQRAAEKEDKTPFQKYLDKRKEKRKEKRETNKNDSDSDPPSDIDMNDPYFAEEFNKSEFKKKQTNLEVESDDDNDKEQSKAQLELLLSDDEDNKKHFSLKKIQDHEDESKSKRKRKKKNVGDREQEDDFAINVNDERFSALFTSHHYNIDPTDSHYKKTKGMEKLISEKIKRRTNDESSVSNTAKKQKMEPKSAELNVLVKSVKQKVNNFHVKK